VIKLRLERHLRTKEYNELFAGDPNWVTEALGGMAVDGRTLVTKNSFRFLHTLRTLGPAPEPNMTILWSKNLPDNFKRYAVALSIETSSLQYENDDLMRPSFGDDYGIACCVSAMQIGKEMQFFGARANLGKLLLYALNGGRDEISGEQVGLKTPVYQGDYLDFDEVYERLEQQLEWLAALYVNTLNLIHYLHDRYAYERIEMALHDVTVIRDLAMGIAGLSVVADSLSAIKYAKVKPLYDDRGLIVAFDITGDFPKYGNDDDRVDQFAVSLVKSFMKKLKKTPAYRGARHTLSVLTITSNVVYGRLTGNTPDGREAGAPFAPGANPLHGREEHGALAACNSIAKLPYDYARDGISYTFSTTPGTLGTTKADQITTLAAVLDGYFEKTGHHININVLNKDTLLDAMEHPENYPDLTIRVSGYAVHFVRLSRKHQEEVIARTSYDFL
jgi:formate C-acetyltransferase